MPKKNKKKQKSGPTPAAPRPPQTVSPTAAATGGVHGGVHQHPTHVGPNAMAMSGRTGLSPEVENISLERDKEMLHSDLSNLMATAQDIFAQTAALSAAHSHSHSHPRSTTQAAAHTHQHALPLPLPTPEQLLSPTAEYWTQLPPSVRSFIKSARKKFPVAANGGEMTEAERQKALNSIMKSLVRGQNPLTNAVSGGTIPGAFPDWTGEEWETYARGVGLGLGMGDYLVGPEGEEMDPELELEDEEEYYAEEDQEPLDDDDLDYDEPPELIDIQHGHEHLDPDDDDEEDEGRGGKKNKKKKKKGKVATPAVAQTAPL
jgi:hypothetical protein